MLDFRKPIVKPAKGDIVRDAIGNRFEVQEVGVRWVKARNLKTDIVGLIRIKDVFKEAPKTT